MIEIIWKGLQQFINEQQHILYADLHAGCIASKSEKYAMEIFDKGRVLEHCKGFLDGTVIGIDRPGINSAQKDPYKAQKRKKSLKFQTITSPDRILIHENGSLEGRRNDVEVYVVYGIEAQL